MLVEVFDDEVDIAENQVRKRLRGHRGYRAVQALHGVGPVMAAIFVAEVGDVCRFVPPATSAAGPGSPPCKASQTIRRAGATSPNKGPRWCAGPPSRQSYATTAGPHRPGLPAGPRAPGDEDRPGGGSQEIANACLLRAPGRRGPVPEKRGRLSNGSGAARARARRSTWPPGFGEAG